MAISNVWVFAQGVDGAPTTATQELLTKARELSSSVTAFVAGEADSFAAGLGEFGATKVYATGDLGVSPVGWAGAGQEILDVASAPERQAGEIVEDDGEGYTKIVEFLDKLKVI